MFASRPMLIIPDFWEMVASLEKSGWSIAMHGCYHIYTTKKGGLFPLNHLSEFAGLSEERQRELIRAGKDALKIHGIETDLFMAPAHSFEQGIADTVDWYLDNQPWVQRVLDGSYRLERIGATA